MVDLYGYSVATIPFIVIVVYGIIELLKNAFFYESEKFRKFIPVYAALIGALIGVLTYWIAPEMIPAAKWYGAILTGLASGLSAVGVNQIGKQMLKGGDKGGS